MTKFGKDKDLEAQADEILAGSVGPNARGIDRDIEKMAYEHGFIEKGDLKFYDPDNDWDTHDQPSVWLVDVPELHVGAGSPRSALMRHIEDDDDWGDAREDIPPVGVNSGPRKSCTKCWKSKGLQYFSSDARNRDGLRSWCKECRRQSERISYARKSE